MYRFRENTQSFVPADDFNQNLGSKVRVKYLKEDAAGNIWFVAGDEAGLLVIDDLGLKRVLKKGLS